MALVLHRRADGYFLDERIRKIRQEAAIRGGQTPDDVARIDRLTMSLDCVASFFDLQVQRSLARRAFMSDDEFETVRSAAKWPRAPFRFVKERA